MESLKIIQESYRRSKFCISRVCAVQDLFRHNRRPLSGLDENSVSRINNITDHFSRARLKKMDGKASYCLTPLLMLNRLDSDPAALSWPRTLVRVKQSVLSITSVYRIPAWLEQSFTSAILIIRCLQVDKQMVQLITIFQPSFHRFL